MSRGAMKGLLSPVMLPVVVLLSMAGCREEKGSARSRETMMQDIARTEAEFRSLLEAPEGVDWEAPEVAPIVSGLLRGYADFANAHREDSLSGAFLMRRADLLQGRGDAPEAEDQWLDVIDGFPASRYAPEAMFRVGFLRETMLGDTAGAMEAYGQLVAVYPESPWSDQAAASIKWLGFSKGELIRSLMEGD